MTADPFRLARFVAAQDAVWPAVLAELGAGRKRTHWMWFVFPQLAGLGNSDMSRRYAIASLAEARAYVTHPVLAPRLLDATRLVEQAQAPSVAAIFGAVDAQKFRSCMTLFAMAEPGEPVFEAVLQRFFAGERDARTLELVV